MATKLIQAPIPPCSYVFPPKSVKTTMKLHTSLYYNNPHCRLWSRSSSSPPPLRLAAAAAAAAAADLLTDEEDYRASSSAQIKQHLLAALQGINRGIFGVPSEKKSEIENLVELLESRNPNPQPTLCLEKVGGAWRLIYSTITILGSKRTKLGLRDFITLGDFFQSINVAQGKAVNTIKFSAKGLNMLRGQLTIDASFKIATESRVDISYNKSVITPDQLMNVFRKNYDLLLGIFNPEGWLEITYVDDSFRIGRDDKGNIFILERVEGDNS